MLTPEQVKEAVEEFKEIFKKQFDIELSDEEATELAMGVLQVFVDAVPLQGVAQR